MTAPRRPDPSLPPPVTALSRESLEEFVESLGRPRFHGRQVRASVLKRGLPSFASMTDLPADLREDLERELRIESSRPESVQRSRDGTVKLLIRLEDGESVESVLIPEGKRMTLCISSEVGCPVRCSFCASGLEGLVRPLGTHEIVEQVLHARRMLVADGTGPLTNLVLMGMGEPLLNYEAVHAALEVLRDPDGIALGARRITLSTVGILEGMERLAAERHPINLAVSLHAPDDETRSVLVPLNARYGVDRVAEAARRYAATTKRDVTFEYVMLDGVNDSEAQARRLAGHASGGHVNVNLIPWNPVEGMDYSPPPPERIQAFAGILRRRGVPVHVRKQRGEDIDAACGQLRLKADGPGAPGTARGPGPTEV